MENHQRLVIPLSEIIPHGLSGVQYARSEEGKKINFKIKQNIVTDHHKG